jgi:hypothetical protein
VVLALQYSLCVRVLEKAGDAPAIAGTISCCFGKAILGFGIIAKLLFDAFRQISFRFGLMAGGGFPNDKLQDAQSKKSSPFFRPVIYGVKDVESSFCHLQFLVCPPDYPP